MVTIPAADTRSGNPVSFEHSRKQRKRRAAKMVSKLALPKELRTSFISTVQLRCPGCPIIPGPMPMPMPMPGAILGLSSCEETTRPHRAMLQGILAAEEQRRLHHLLRPMRHPGAAATENSGCASITMRQTLLQISHPAAAGAWCKWPWSWPG